MNDSENKTENNMTNYLVYDIFFHSHQVRAFQTGTQVCGRLVSGQYGTGPDSPHHGMSV